MASDLDKERFVEIWSKAVDTQMHFNEMSVKARQFGLTFVAAALGLGIVLLTRPEPFTLSVNLFGGFNIHVAVLISLGSAVALYAVKGLDINVYHKMLRGAVAFGEDFEQNYMKEVFSLNKGMTQAISYFSRHDDASVKTVDGKSVYEGSRSKEALSKIEKFYNTSISILVVIAVVLFLVTGNFGYADRAAAAAKDSKASSSIPIEKVIQPTASPPVGPAEKIK